MVYNSQCTIPRQYLTGIITTGQKGVTNYDQLSNKPQINGIELTGNKTAIDLKLQPIMKPVSNEEIEEMFK